MSKKKGDGSNPLRDILVQAEIKTDSKSAFSIPKRIATWTTIALLLAWIFVKAEPKWEHIKAINEMPDGPVSKFDTLKTQHENLAVANEHTDPCLFKDVHSIKGLTKVKASAEVLANKDAGQLNVHVNDDVTITIQAGTFSFGPSNPTPPPFNLIDMREGFTAEGNAALTIKRCK